MFTRIDSAAQPERIISGIAVDTNDPLHAFVSYSGYEACTPGTPGRVFELHYNPKAGTPQWNDLSAGLGDQPIQSIACDSDSHRLYVSTDYGVLVRDHGVYLPLATGLPLTAVYQLVLDQGSHMPYSATHGRGAYRIDASG